MEIRKQANGYAIRVKGKGRWFGELGRRPLMMVPEGDERRKARCG